MASLKTFRKEISATYVKRGELLWQQNAVRELDKEQEGTYVAYVDEGKESYDVRIELDKKTTIVAHHCDCPEEYLFCQHQVAVLLKLTTEDSLIPAAKVRKKKTKPSDDVLAALSYDALVGFLQAVFAADKALELRFMQEFNTQSTIWTKDSVLLATKAAKSSVVKNRKKIVKPELKKILDLIKPTVNEYTTQIGSNITPANFIEFVETTGDLHDQLMDLQITSATKGHLIIDMCKTLSVALLQRESDLRLVCCTKLLSYFSNTATLVKPVHTVLLGQILVNADAILQKAIVDIAVKNNTLQKIHRNQDSLARILLQYVTTKEQVVSFSLLAYADEHNTALVNKYIELGELVAAEKLCIEGCESDNFFGNKFRFIRLLHTIHEQSQDPAMYLRLLRVKAPCFDSVQEYETLYNTLTQPNSRAKLTSDYEYFMQYNHVEHKTIERMYFEYLDGKRNYKVLLDRIQYASLTTILPFYNSLYNYDRLQFLKKLMDKEDHPEPYDDAVLPPQYHDEQSFDALKTLLLTNYTKAEVVTALAGWNYRSANFRAAVRAWFEIV
jgi:hypothetical protein